MSNDRGDDTERTFVQVDADNAVDAVLIHNLLRTHAYLSPFIDARLRPLKLTAAQFNTLLVLHSAAESGLLMSQIGERLVVTKPNVTALVDRLEQQGLVKRCEHRDRRATLVRLTPEGRRLADQTLPAYGQLLGELTGDASDC